MEQTTKNIDDFYLIDLREEWVPQLGPDEYMQPFCRWDQQKGMILALNIFNKKTGNCRTVFTGIGDNHADICKQRIDRMGQDMLYKLES